MIDDVVETGTVTKPLDSSMEGNSEEGGTVLYVSNLTR